MPYIWRVEFGDFRNMPLKKNFISFLLLLLSVYAIWFVAYEFYLKPSGKLDHLLTEYVTIGICFLLDIGGYTSYYTIALKPGETYIFISTQILPAVRIGASCNGLELLALFSIFILCYPGNFLLKIPFISIGILILHFLNILRNYWLTLMSLHHYPYADIFHRYLFIFMVYGCIFLLWMVWTNYLSTLNNHGKKQ